jgi:hypothetical protein
MHPEHTGEEGWGGGRTCEVERWGGERRGWYRRGEVHGRGRCRLRGINEQVLTAPPRLAHACSRMYIAHYIFADLYYIFANRRVILLSCLRFARQFFLC